MSYDSAFEKVSSLNGQDAIDRQRYDRVSITKPNDSGEMTQVVDQSNEITIAQRMVSATVGSVLTSLLVTPLDVVRVRLQSQNPSNNTPEINPSRLSAYTANFSKIPKDLGVNSCCKDVFSGPNSPALCLAGNGTATISEAAGADCAVQETQRKTFNSTLDGLRKIARNEGATTLWRGLSPTLVMAIPANVIYFTGYDWLRYNSTSPVRALSNDTYNPLISGSFARVMAALVVSPIEMFRTRIQSTRGGTEGVFRKTLSDMHQMTQAQGYTSLWRGLTLTMWRDVPFSAFYWWGYEALRNTLRNARGEGVGNLVPTVHQQSQQKEDSHMQTLVDSFVAGSGAGAVAALVTTPFDVGKTRQQIFRHAGDDGRKSLSKAAQEAVKRGNTPPEEMSMLRFLFHILKEEGMPGLMKGWAARCLKVAPACAIMISSYEVGKKWARGVNSQSQKQAMSRDGL